MGVCDKGCFCYIRHFYNAFFFLSRKANDSITLLTRNNKNYILTNVRNSVLYVGVTNDLERRLYEHREGYSEKSFSNRYHTHKLVYYETCSDVASSIEREKQIKGYSRAKKIELIKKVNPDWSDLSKEWE